MIGVLAREVDAVASECPNSIVLERVRKAKDRAEVVNDDQNKQVGTDFTYKTRMQEGSQFAV